MYGKVISIFGQSGTGGESSLCDRRIKGAVALGCRKKVASSVILFSTRVLMYGIAFEREIDCSFVVLVTILKHFEKKVIKKYQNFMTLDNVECKRIPKIGQICK